MINNTFKPQNCISSINPPYRDLSVYYATMVWDIEHQQLRCHKSISISCMTVCMECKRLMLGFHTGMRKPVGFPKWVTWVWVRFWFLAHRDTPHTHTMVSWVLTGLLQQGEPNFSCFKSHFFLVFSYYFLLCHTMTPARHSCASCAYSFASSLAPPQGKIYL